MKQLIFLFSLIFLTLTTAFAHGENKYGPHKGFIRMPGTFHTELVANSDGSFFVYLLDLQNKNSTTKDSSIEVQIKTADKTKKLDCMVMGDFFHCPNETLLKSGQVIIKAIRLGTPAREAVYDLPLKLTTDPKAHDMSKMK